LGTGVVFKRAALDAIEVGLLGCGLLKVWIVSSDEYVIPSRTTP